MKTLNVPYFSQRDNSINPSGACNVTSVAMCLYYFGIRGNNPNIQIEDQLYQRCEDRGFDRHSPDGLRQLVESYGCKDDLTLNGSLADIRKAIDQGKPCIVHGYFTNFGHIIVIKGYDDKGFVVNDPWGELDGAMGRYGSKVGKDLHYSNRLIAAYCHAYSHSDAVDLYKSIQSFNTQKQEAMKEIWLHRISR